MEADPEAVEVSTASLTYAECLSQPLCSDYANQGCSPVGSVLECCQYNVHGGWVDYWLDYLVCEGTGSDHTGHWLYE